MSKLKFVVVGICLLLASLAQANELVLKCSAEKLLIDLNFEKSIAYGFGVSGAFQTRGESGGYYNYSIDSISTTTTSTITTELNFKTTVSLVDLNPGAQVMIQTSLFQCSDEGWQSGCSPTGGGSFECTAITNQ